MKTKILFFCLCLAFTYCQDPPKPDKICGARRCYQGYGNCSDDNSTCICDDYHHTFPEDSDLMCNYIKKSQLVAFLLEAFVTFGAGHFYVSNLGIAIPKFLIWILGYTFFISLRILSAKRQDNDITLLLISLGGCISCFIMVVWQLIDVIMFGLNEYYDGNGVDLYQW